MEKERGVGRSELVDSLHPDLLYGVANIVIHHWEEIEKEIRGEPLSSDQTGAALTHHWGRCNIFRNEE